MPWFKNMLTYRFTRSIEIDAAKLEEQLDEFKFTPCGKQDVQKFGWTKPLGKHGQMFTHIVGDNILICARQEEKILPAPVIKEAVNDKIDKQEEDLGRRLKKKEKDTIKDEVVLDLLPRAFSRKTQTHALIMPKLGFIVVDASSFKKAENMLALLRKTIGSLPVVPIIAEKAVAPTLTQWSQLKDVPVGFTVGVDAEFSSVEEDASVIRCKNQTLNAEEITAHIDANKLAIKLSLGWQDRLDFELNTELAIKKIKFSNELKEQNEDIDREDYSQRLDADITLMAGEFEAFIPDLIKAVGGLEKRE